MYVIPHTQEMIDNSLRKAKELGALNRSITRGQGNAAGYLGEEAVASYLGADIMSSNEGTNKFNYDLILPNGIRAEVKSKRRTVPPQDFYDVSIAESSTHQRPDIYIFVSLQFGIKTEAGKYNALEHVWLVGQKTPEDFFRLATLWKKGDVDATNNFTTHADMYNLPINKLDGVVK